jgi:hypothetical protein
MAFPLYQMAVVGSCHAYSCYIHHNLGSFVPTYVDNASVDWVLQTHFAIADVQYSDSFHVDVVPYWNGLDVSYVALDDFV